MDFLIIGNTCDTNLLVELPSVSLAGVVSVADVPCLATHSFVLDFRAGDKRLAKGLVRVKHNGSAPTSGSFTATGVR